jgi:uroporphyrinogen-III synthase
LADQLDAMGLSPIVMPMYTFAAHNPSIDKNLAWSSAETRRLAVFTSPRAVHFGLVHIPDKRLKDIEFAVVGSATRARLESSGHRVHLQAATGFTSEDLLQLPELAVDPGEAVIFCAPGGRDALEIGLRDLGWKVIKAMVYQRVPLQPTSDQLGALRSTADLLTIWTSISALDLAKETLPTALWVKILEAPALVISTRIQHYLTGLGATCVALTDGPGNPELLQSVLRLTGQGVPG